MKNTYYHTCKRCGASLDPGETCDCYKDDDNDCADDTCNADESQQITKMCEE